MKNKILLGIVVTLSIITLVVVNSNEKEEDHSFFYNDNSIKIKDEENNIKELNVEEYLIGVLAAEMPASFELEALKAQAVAARTYALYKVKHTQNSDYNILTTISDQSYITEEEMKNKWQNEFDKYYNKIKSAISETKDEIMYYNNEIIEAFYFSMSNGYTEKAQTVFQQDLPYIDTVISSWDNDTIKNFNFSKEISKENFCQKLELDNCNFINIQNIKRNETNHVEEITINNKSFNGIDVRKRLDLRSTDFSIKNLGNNLIIETKGYGHGVGMSQYGANGMAKEGYNYKDILNYYYQDITINKMV